MLAVVSYQPKAIILLLGNNCVQSKTASIFDRAGTAGDAVKAELRPKQPKCVIGVGGTYLGLNNLAASIDSYTHAGLEGLHASI